MSFFNRFATKFLNNMEARAAIRVHQHLLNVDPADLRRAGISPDLFARGPAAYPWREDSATAQATANTKGSAAVAQLHNEEERNILNAIAELRACSDVELSDLGIARGDIPQAVREGRPGIDRPLHRQDRQAAA